MHILYLHQFFTTPHGSSGTRSHTFARRFVELGHRVTLVTGAVDGVAPTSPRLDIVVDGIDVVQLGVDYRQELTMRDRKRAFMEFAQRATTVCTTGIDRVDVVFATSTPLTVAIPALAASARWGAPMVFEVRDLWPDAPIALGALGPAQALVARALEHAAYAGAEAVVALSPGMLDAVRRRGADPRSQMIPNGVDRALFQDLPTRREARARFALPQDDFLVVYVGALGPVHGIGLTLDAVRLAAARGVTGLRFVLFGDGSMRADVAAVAAQHPQHLIAPGPIPRLAVPAALCAADVSLTTVADEPILRTTCSNKLFDAMGAGRPQIVNLPGWNSELVESEGIGYIAAPGSGEALLDAALRARDDANRAARGARAQVLGLRYEREKFAEAVLALLEDAATRRAGRWTRAARRLARGAA